MTNLPWIETDNALQKEFSFKDFNEAFSFMTAVALESEKMNHHPWWSNVWNTVQIRLNTHDAGNIVTDKDHRLSEKIDLIYKKYWK